MTSLSRNDPCPCGSGRKFKRCCGASGALALEPFAAPTDATIQSPAHYETDRSRAFDLLVEFGLRDEFAHHRFRCYAHFWGPYADRMRDPNHELRQRVPMIASSEIHNALVDSPLHGGRTVIQTLLERERARLAPGVARFLTQFARSCVSLYEIVRVEPGRGFELVDLWRSGSTFVHERLASQQLDRWDLLGARLITQPDGRVVIDSDLWPFHPPAKQELIAELEREHAALRRVRGDVPADVFLKSSSHVFARVFARLHFEPETPELRTFDGEPLEPTVVRFEVQNLTKLRRRLATCPDLDRDGDVHWVWGETHQGIQHGLGWIDLTPPPDRALVATAMSRTHAERLRALLERVAQDALAWTTTQTSTLKDWIAEGRDLAPRKKSPSSMELAEPTVDRTGQQIARAYEERHFREWPDVALPALDGLTPRAAASDEALRPRVVEMLKEAERFQQRRARSGGPDPIDLTDVWRTLGLEVPSAPNPVVPANLAVVDIVGWVVRHGGQVFSGRQGARFDRYSAIVESVASDVPRGIEFMTELACSRRPARRKCLGRIQVVILDDAAMRWRCAVCGDGEELVGWKLLLDALEARGRAEAAKPTPLRRVDPANPWSALYAAAFEFRDLAPWSWLVDEHVFGVEDPETGEIGWCCTLGAAGAVEGLAVYLGDRGFDQWRQMRTADSPEDAALFGQDALVVSFGARESTSPVERERLRSLGLKCRGSRAWPSTEYFAFGRVPRPLELAEATRLAHTLDQAQRVAERVRDARLTIEPDSAGRFLVRRHTPTVRGQGGWADEQVEPPKPVVRTPPPLDWASIEQLRRSLPRPAGCWEVEVLPFPGAVRVAGGDPCLPVTVLAVDRGTGLVVHVDVQAPGDLLGLAQAGLLDAVRSSRRPPATVCVHRAWLRDALAPLADALGIRIESQEELKVLANVVERLEEFLERERPM